MKQKTSLQLDVSFDEFKLIINHMVVGRYCDVAQTLQKLQGQVDRQLAPPQPKIKPGKQATNVPATGNGAARYAKVP